MSSAQFILSLDCEGKWGVADHLTAFEKGGLTDRSLRTAYASIIALLDEFRLPATFAFVGVFTQSKRQFAIIRPELDRLASTAPYLRQALGAVTASDGDGWHGADLVDAIGSAKSAHEIALHGVTHVTWDSVDLDFATAELALLERLKGPIRESRTFIYPRNRVAHVEALKQHGFAGFRTAGKVRSRLRSLAAEFNLFEGPEIAAEDNGIVPIPSGQFVNWRHGPRKLVPSFITAKRAALLLERSAKEGGVVHYWLHPENVATAPQTLGSLRSIVAAAARIRDAGRCEVVTQIDYCRQLVGRPN